jgi:hypothetical protein
MISNEKNMNYKVVSLNEVYNCRITFISKRVHKNEKWFFKKKDMLPREENLC